MIHLVKNFTEKISLELGVFYIYIFIFFVFIVFLYNDDSKFYYHESEWLFLSILILAVALSLIFFVCSGACIIEKDNLEKSIKNYRIKSKSNKNYCKFLECLEKIEGNEVKPRAIISAKIFTLKP